MKDQKEIRNIAASVKERLRNIAVSSGKDFQSVLRQYIQERFLFRLSKSLYSNHLILKGALLFIAHNISRSRPTKDIDFLGSDVSNDKDDLTEIIKEVLRVDCSDGILFKPNDVESENIVEDSDYHGVRLKFFGYLENTRERIQLDIGFGDKIVQGPVEIEFPTLLDFPAPLLKVYSIESAIAEKFEAIVSLQLQTSRLKDFYDIFFFASNYIFHSQFLKEAIVTTFNQRETDLKQRSTIYNEEFAMNSQKQIQWTSFLERSKLTSENSFSTVVEKINSFIEPLFSFNELKTWNPKEWKWI